jgi:hypothetical protein
MKGTITPRASSSAAEGTLRNDPALTPLSGFAEMQTRELAAMNWKIGLDALIEETMAFAKSVKVSPSGAASPVVAAVEPLIAEPPPTRQQPLSNSITSERDEIRRRVENFKAHQQKMTREREDYYLQTKARTFAMIGKNKPSEN